MMVQRVFPTHDNMVTFTCPKCEKPRIINIAEHKNLERKKNIRVRCTCGHKYQAVIERRKQFRKETNFPGIYKHVDHGREVGKGNIVVTDLSRTGLKIKLYENPNLVTGDILILEFRLDDIKRTFIEKKVVIKKIFNLEFGVEFTSTHLSNPSDKALGFYMMG